MAVQKRDADVLRDEASNIFEAMPTQSRRSKKKVRLPKRRRSCISPFIGSTTCFTTNVSNPKLSQF